MKKLAIFVEGQTEQIFITKLLEEIAYDKNIQVILKQARKNDLGHRVFTEIKATSEEDGDFYIIIYDSVGGSSVKSDIRDNAKNLLNANYFKIIGIKDVYPVARTDIDRLKRSLLIGIPLIGIPIEILLAIMEIEAWFIAETNHFKNIDSGITLAKIESELNLVVIPEEVENIDHPSAKLNEIYNIAGCTYTKTKTAVEKTVSAIDYSELYNNTRYKVNSMGLFFDELDSYFT